jgi:hypothetical protein
VRFPPSAAQNGDFTGRPQHQGITAFGACFSLPLAQAKVCRPAVGLSIDCRGSGWVQPLLNKIVWVTGAGSSIGEATALTLAKAGGAVVLTGRRREPLETALDSHATVRVTQHQDAHPQHGRGAAYEIVTGSTAPTASWARWSRSESASAATRSSFCGT